LCGLLQGIAWGFASPGRVERTQTPTEVEGNHGEVSFPLEEMCGETETMAGALLCTLLGRGGLEPG